MPGKDEFFYIDITQPGIAISSSGFLDPAANLNSVES